MNEKLNAVVEICKTNNRVMQVENGYDLMVLELDAKQQEQLKEMGCTYEWITKGKFFIVHTPVPKPAAKFSWTYPLWILVFAYILFMMYQNEVHLDVQDWVLYWTR